MDQRLQHFPLDLDLVFGILERVEITCESGDIRMIWRCRRFRPLLAPSPQPRIDVGGAAPSKPLPQSHHTCRLLAIVWNPNSNAVVEFRCRSRVLSIAQSSCVGAHIAIRGARPRARPRVVW